MSSIRELAHEFNAQPHEVAAFADLGWPYDETEPLDAEDEAFIRDAWAAATADDTAKWNHTNPEAYAPALTLKPCGRCGQGNVLTVKVGPYTVCEPCAANISA